MHTEDSAATLLPTAHLPRSTASNQFDRDSCTRNLLQSSKSENMAAFTREGIHYYRGGYSCQAI